MKSQSTNKIPVLSFYSGGGFMDMGFEQAGFEIVWTNEFDSTFAELHAAGITSWRKSNGNRLKAEIFNTKSIVDIPSKTIIKEAFPEGKPDHFGIIGGPPCQDFSRNGKRKGFRGSRGKLTIHYINKIYDLRPSFFVMENVKGLMKHEAYLMKLLDKIKKHYKLDYKVLNALDFGVPQSRERVFFVGIRKDLLIPNKLKPENPFSWPVNQKYKDALTKFPWPAQVAFGSKLSIPKKIPLKLCVGQYLIADNDFSSIPNSDEYFNFWVKTAVLNKIREGQTNRPSFKRLHRYKFSPTACYGNNEVHLHPFKHRRISVREALRIQGVPDSYVLPKEIQLTKKFKMIGNGVPVPLARAVAKSVMKVMIKLM